MQPSSNPHLSAGPSLYRRAVLQALLWFTAAGGLFFGTVNLYGDNVGLASAEFVMAALSVWLVVALKRARHLQRWILAYLIPFFCVMILALAGPGTSPTIFSWVLLIPILSHLLLGRWLGMIAAGIFMGLAGLIFLWRFDDQPVLTNFVAISNIGLSSIAIFVFSHVYEISRARTEDALRSLALTDPLTGLANRTQFREVFGRESSRAFRERTQLSLLIIDLDHFKRVNDTFGHDAGDEVLRFVSGVLKSRLRNADLISRLGGEEFGVILPDTCGKQAAIVAEDLRLIVEAMPCPYRDIEIPVTTSIGVAELGPDGDDMKSLFAVADERLYQGKAKGRNLVVGPRDRNVETAFTFPGTGLGNLARANP